VQETWRRGGGQKGGVAWIGYNGWIMEGRGGVEKVFGGRGGKRDKGKEVTGKRE